MSRSSCIRHPEKEPLVILRQSYVELCQNNHCAAALLNLFEYWHNIKLAISTKHKKLNDIAEAHGDRRVHDESLLQFNSQDEIREQLLETWSRPTIAKNIEYLEKRCFITKTRNPNPRYKFDRITFYLFHEDNVNHALNVLVTNKSQCSEKEGNAVTSCDSSKENSISTVSNNLTPDGQSVNHRDTKNLPPVTKSLLSSPNFLQTIPEITNKDYKREEDKKEKADFLKKRIATSSTRSLDSISAYKSVLKTAHFGINEWRDQRVVEMLQQCIEQKVSASRCQVVLQQLDSAKPEKNYNLLYFLKVVLTHQQALIHAQPEECNSIGQEAGWANAILTPTDRLERSS